jgi:dienelactone hydrolase
MGFPLADFMVFPIARLHRELGLNLAFPVLPFHGPRKVGWRTGDFFFSGDYVDTVHTQANAVWDVRRLLSWIRAQDAPAVGVYGLSLGGLTAALVASLEHVDCVVAGIPATDYVSLAHWNLPPALMGFFERQGLAWDEVRRLVRLISPLALAPRVARERRFLFAAAADRLVPPQHAVELWRHWEEPRLDWYAGSHVSFGWEPVVHAMLGDAATALNAAPSSSARARRPG